MFYATGDKSINLNRTLENTIRRASSYEEPQESPPALPVKKPKKVKPDSCPKPRPVLYFTKKKGNAETKTLIDKSRDNEKTKNPLSSL